MRSHFLAKSAEADDGLGDVSYNVHSRSYVVSIAIFEERNMPSKESQYGNGKLTILMIASATPSNPKAAPLNFMLVKTVRYR